MSNKEFTRPSATFTFTNKCHYTVWPGILSGATSPPLASTGFQLSPGASRSFLAPTRMDSGRFWARTGCSFDSTGKFSCATGDCNSSQVGVQRRQRHPARHPSLGSPSPVPPPSRTSTMPPTARPAKVLVKRLESRSFAAMGLTLLRRLAVLPPTQEIFKSTCPKSYSYAYDDATRMKIFLRGFSNATRGLMSENESWLAIAAEMADANTLRRDVYLQLGYSMVVITSCFILKFL
ncbi:hypothetical protein J5N97_016219 [Dioscorea zingiberensis]|uniref:Uncharacterized protein n=1 Tax=Dioscorea zingiberensis TaxID=325984 RepID=A0A9D5HF74_9LILI|nr:hypothetical protein J5N97_016219 [Dioscorea zingiberensis]